MNYIDDIGIEQLGVAEWADLINAYFYEPDKFRGYFRNQENAELVGKRIERDMKDLNPDTVLPRIRRKMELLTSAAAPESVKEYWKETILEDAGEEQERSYKPVAERMKQVDAFERGLHEAYDFEEESDNTGLDDPDNPYASRYMEKHTPPTFERNRIPYSTSEAITMYFDRNYIGVADLETVEIFRSLPVPESVDIEAVGDGIKIIFEFYDAYVME